MPTNSVDLSYAMGLKPDAGIKYFESKGYTIGFNWYDVEARAHDTAFTVAGILKQDILGDIRTALQKALEDGTTLADVKKNLIPLLEQKGWLGKRLVADSDGVLEGRQLMPRRLDGIFQNNMQAAYNAGRYVEQLKNKAARPYLERIGILDHRIRPTHYALHGFVAHIDDPIWQIIYTPDGFRCRCRVRSRSAADVGRLGLMVQSSEGRIVEVEQPWGKNETRMVKAFKKPDGSLYVPDAGFGHNPGSGYLAALGQNLLDKGARGNPYLASIAVHETFKNGALLDALSSDVKQFVSNVLLNKKATGAQRQIGALPVELIGGLSTRSPAIITLKDDAILKTRNNVELLIDLPRLILRPDAILKNNDQLIYVVTHNKTRFNVALTQAQSTNLIESITPFNASDSELVWGVL
jgi:SPP1 gp7 family putative phage head morphogenesis protein